VETRRLYYEDPYLREFEAVVIAVEEDGVILNQTAFYPEGGGQAGDIGTLNDVRVINTIQREGHIIHLVEEPEAFKVGDEVRGILNWSRRYRIMRLHSASHIMEYFLYQRLGPLERLGSHVDERKDRADYAYDGRLPPEALRWVEEQTNRFIAEGHPIVITLDPDRPGWRIWRCGPIEMYCAGTHVRNTREIGRVRLRRRNPGRGVERVETLLAED